MEYEIVKLNGRAYSKKIDQAEFENLKVVMENLIEALSIEEKLNLVLENFAEFERDMLEISLNQMIFPSDTWSSLMTRLHTINRRLLNLLAACRLYVDHIPQNLAAIYGKNAEATQAFAEIKSQEYDSIIGYRVMEAIRNYAQHRNLPIGGISLPASRVDRPAGAVWVQTVVPYIDVTELENDKNFKPAVLGELKAQGDKAEIKLYVRQYIESIGRIHELVRQSLAPDLKKWDETVSSMLEAVKQASGEQVHAVVAFAIDENQVKPQQVTVFTDPIERRRWLEEKNRRLTHFTYHVVTSETNVG